MRWLSRLLLLMVLTGCASAPAIRYYQIQPDPAPIAATASRAPLRLGIGPIKLPPYLDRSKIILIQQNSEIKLAQYSEWAGALDDNIAAVLARDIGAYLGTDKISRYPWPPETELDYRIEIELIRLHGLPSGDFELEAHWRIKDRTRNTLSEHLSRFRVPLQGAPNPPAEELNQTVAAHSAVLRQLARTISEVLQKIPAGSE